MRLQDLDDIAPPTADSSTLATVRNRGRHLRHRRHVGRGAVAVAIVGAVVAGAIAVGGRDSGPRTVSVEPTTTVPGVVPPAFEREADVGGVHYTLVLHTPLVMPGATVTVELLVDNRTQHVVHLAACVGVFDVTVFTVGSARHVVKPSPCKTTSANALAAGGGLDDSAQTTAPRRPGRYLVGVDAAAELPSTLLVPLELQVATAAQTTGTVACSTEVSISSHPSLPATAGIPSIPGLTKVASDAGGLAPFKGMSRGPAANCRFTAVGGVGQYWLLSAAVAHYGSANNVPLPLPLSFASRYQGPEEVNVDIVVFQDVASAQALLNDPDYSTNPEWTRPPGVSIPDGFIAKDYSFANGGLNDFISQQAIGNTWIQVGAAGANLTLTQAARLAQSVGQPYESAETHARAMCVNAFGDKVTSSYATTVGVVRSTTYAFGVAPDLAFRNSFPEVDAKSFAAWCVVEYPDRGTLTPAEKSQKNPRCWQESAVAPNGAKREIESVCGITKPFPAGPPFDGP